MTDSNNVDSVKNTLRQIDRPFIPSIWETSNEEGKDAFGMYLKNIGLQQYRKLTWADSVFDEKEEKVTPEQKKENARDEALRSVAADVSLDEMERLGDKWGHVHEPEMRIYFEKKYDSLVNNQPVNTPFHEEALRTYCVYKVKAEFATAKGDVKDAKEWATLAQKQGEIAKINPNKLTESDFMQGVSSFSEVARRVEREVDIIPILPQFIEKPNDKLDIAILSFINYSRRMKGLPDAEYNDIYEFYQDNLRDYLEDDTKSPEIKKRIKEIEITTESGTKKKILFYDVYEIIELRKKQFPNDQFIQNLDKWMEMISYFRWNPCAFYQLMETEDGGGIKLDADQKFVLRCLARFPKNYIVFPRG